MEIQPIPLGSDLQIVFDRYQRDRIAAARGRAADKRAKDAKAEVIEAMGESTFGSLPDGRIIQRITRSRDMPALPKCTQSWEDLDVVQLGVDS